jgi:hypothetical protein
MIPDMLNGLFELFGAGFIALSVRKLHRERIVRGISWGHVAFFMVWGYWNLYYYPSLDQWFSFVGGLGIVAMNTVYFAQLVYFTQAERQRRQS